MERRLTCRKILSLLLLSVFLFSSLFTVSSASAIQIDFGNSFTGTWRTSPNPGFADIGLGNATQRNFNISEQDIYVSGTGNEVVTRYYAYINETIPADSLISYDYNITIRLTSAQQQLLGYKFYGTTGLESKGIISEECFDPNSGSVINPGSPVTSSRSITCHVIEWTGQETTGFGSRGGSRFLEFPYSNILVEWTLIVQQPSILHLTNDSLSLNDRAWLAEHMSSGTSSAEIESAIDSAREDEKSEYEDQAEETEDIANDESSAAQGTATSLLSVVGQFIGVLTSAQPTNCNLNGNLIPHLPLGNLDLCQYSPPAAITALGSLLLIAFVVPLAYNTVKRMLALIGSFQS